MASKFTPQVRGGLIERLSAGLTIEDACRAVGITIQTYKNWQGKARKGSPEYVQFAKEVENARKIASERPEPMDEDELLHVVSEAARKGSVQAMKLRWEMICAKRDLAKAEAEPERDTSTRNRIDELAARRAVRVAS